ncbi:ATP-binding protein [Gordonibacter sp.]|uniref:ATP-binding protein n=1 Tax=Gordonibacter sp. TaxID=1968902 RepID=UPI002FCC6C07
MRCIHACPSGALELPESRPHVPGEAVVDKARCAVRCSAPSGSVQVSCACERESVVVKVADSGISISPDELQAVFRRFYRNDCVRFVNPEGTGLGLSIAQWIAGRHHAGIHCASVLGEGTTVAFVFGETAPYA